jgi:O-acetyl-ADP-ribose deacetylase (regulator of RNase III)
VNNALELLDRESESNGLASIVFPLLGSGAGGRPFPEVINSMLRQILAYLDKNPRTHVERIYLLAPITEILREGTKIFDAMPGVRRLTIMR